MALVKNRMCWACNGRLKVEGALQAEEIAADYIAWFLSALNALEANWPLYLEQTPSVKSAYDQWFTRGTRDEDSPQAFSDLPITVWAAAGWLCANFVKDYISEGLAAVKKSNPHRGYPRARK